MEINHKNINRNSENVNEIIEEMADVQIMIIQLIMIYSEKDSEITNKFWGAIDYKILRLKERLGK